MKYRERGEALLLWQYGSSKSDSEFVGLGGQAFEESLNLLRDCVRLSSSS